MNTEFAYRVLRSLKVSSIAAVVDRLWPVFHKDPIQYFPPEVMSQIFSYLTPSMLLEASRASRTWRERVLDSRLWKHKFRTEGWGLDVEEIERFENTYNIRRSGSRQAQAAQGKQRDIGGKEARRSSSTSQSNGTQKTYRMPKRATFRSQSLKDSQEEDDQIKREIGRDQEMPDAASPPLDAQSSRESFEKRRISEFLQARERQAQNAKMAEALEPAEASCSVTSPMEVNFDARSQKPQAEKSLVLHTSTGHASLNYHHVFKQKRKLEDNWNNAQYNSFQLPHRDHPEDAHTECVYTIQYSGKYLVSGSRDRTLRVWDLDRQRLVREPLQGHTGSVLCLQFDHSEEEDIVISGSSDTHVILWRFSTGEMIKQLTNAHRESVLNLKFDKRFLVTCSKDKTIKIWNRHALRPGDRDYPVKGVEGGGQCPAYIIDMQSIAASFRNEQINFSEMMLLEPYTHLMTLDLHGAAVNAIQIYKDELVSASGDRNLRVWDIHTGKCATKIEAHAKGIACVQYDGKRIVSGSSDNTIRIWDPTSKTEVARLDGHSRLVRTIQAAFADCPGGREALEAEAEEVKRQWQAASIAGLIPPPMSMGRQHQGVPGSRKPRDVKSVGAKIPPSGGGSRWGRIVSGSYDETIIIWRKTDDDEWVIGHRLRQEEALRAAGPQLIPRSDAQAQAQAPVNLPNHANNPPTNLAAPAQTQVYPAAAQGQNAAQAGLSTQQQGAPSHQQPVNTEPQNPGPPGWNNPALAQAYQQMRQGQQQQQFHAGQNPTFPGIPQQPQQQPPPPAGQPQAPRPPHPAAAAVGPPNARVFKLQFDARRIICCSQDPKIVGWDFANGDEQIIECSRFFTAPE